MLKSLPITAKQAKLISSVQAAATNAQRELDLVVNAVLMGHDCQGRVVSVDSETNVLNVEVPDEP